MDGVPADRSLIAFLSTVKSPWSQGSTPPDIVERAHQKLADTQHRFDDAEHRLLGLFTEGVELLAVRRLKVMRHGLDRAWIFRRGRGLGEALIQG
jgi:hypothetical protein